MVNLFIFLFKSQLDVLEDFQESSVLEAEDINLVLALLHAENVSRIAPVRALHNYVDETGFCLSSYVPYAWQEKGNGLIMKYYLPIFKQLLQTRSPSQPVSLHPHHAHP